MGIGGEIMIGIFNSSLELQAIINNLISSWRFERLNEENTLEFTSVLDKKAITYINENNIVEFDEDYFDIVYYSQEVSDTETPIMKVECEHISYRLNDPAYYTDNFAYTGTPESILTNLLAGTDFTVGTVEFTESMTYSAQEKKSRRQMLMEFVATLGGEVDFDKFEISILIRRGSTDLQIFTTGKNIRMISKIYNGRENPPVVSYTCTPVQTPDKRINIGDDILLIQSELSIQDTLRVVSIGYNPEDETQAEFEISNSVKSLEDKLYKIETTTVAKEKVYNGCKIGPEEGFVATRSDKSVKTVLNATEGISIQFSDDAGSTYEAVFYVSIIDGIPKLYLGGPAIFKGNIETEKSATIGELLKLISPTGTFNSGIQMIADDGVTLLARVLRVAADLLITNYGTGDVDIVSGGDINLVSTGGVVLDTSSYVGSKIAANIIATQGWVEAKNYAVKSAATGSFETADLKTVLVNHGIITDIF